MKPIILYAAVEKIETVQNVAIRTISVVHYLTNNISLLKSYNNLSIKQSAQQAAKITFYRASKSTCTQLQSLGRTTVPTISSSTTKINNHIYHPIM